FPYTTLFRSHAHDLRCGVDAYPGPKRGCGAGEQRLDSLRKPHQDDLERAFVLQRRQGRGDGHGWTVITSHRIDGNPDRRASHLSAIGASPRRCRAQTSSRGRANRLYLFRMQAQRLFRVSLVARDQDLLASIEAVRGDAMTRVRLARGGIYGERRTAQAVVRTMHAALRRGLSALLNCHESLLQLVR